jgi:WD40 repeat protein
VEAEVRAYSGLPGVAEGRQRAPCAIARRAASGTWVTPTGNTGRASRVVTAADDSTARIWDARDWQADRGAARPENWLYLAAFSPDGQGVLPNILNTSFKKSDYAITRTGS